MSETLYQRFDSTCITDISEDRHHPVYILISIFQACYERGHDARIIYACQGNASRGLGLPPIILPEGKKQSVNGCGAQRSQIRGRLVEIPGFPLRG